ncbi:hypothetical protein [Streptococcus suis]|uniref:hypothetical protein n=1 Tax=Streptococcus suis TaxID=1307 RepID=UPI000CF48012|nr:hypothetical protein [Streptococcus suis]
MMILMMSLLLLGLILPTIFIEKEVRETWFLTWWKGMQKMFAFLTFQVKKAVEEDRDTKALWCAKDKFNNAFQNLWNNNESLRKQVHGWNVATNEIYFLNPMNESEFDDFNRNLKDYSRTIHVDCEYQIVGITVPGLREGYGQLFVANFIYKKKADIEEAERLSKLAEIRSNQELDEVQSVL